MKTAGADEAELTRRLVAEGADINARLHTGAMALMFAVDYSRKQAPMSTQDDTATNAVNHCSPAKW